MVSSLHQYITLPETNMEAQKGPYKDYSPSKRGLYEFPCYLGGVWGFGFMVFLIRSTFLRPTV